MLNISFIGFGNSVRNYHLPYIEHHPSLRVINIFRRDVDRLADSESEKHYPDMVFTSNIEDVLSSDNVDLVVICTHSDSHAYYAKLALESGKHILVEKPFARTREEAEEIFNLANSKGLLAFANQNRRYDSDFLTLKKVIDSGKLGKLIELESHYDYFKPQVSKPIFDRLYGLAVHQIDQIVSLFGKPDIVSPDVRSIYYPGQSDDYIDIDLHYSNFKTSVKCSIFVKEHTPKFILYGDKGSFVKFSSGHQSKNKNGRTKLTLTQESKDNWGRLNYINDQGVDVIEHIESEITDYAILYEDIIASVYFSKDKVIKDDEVLTVMDILEKSMEIARNPN